MTNSQIFTAAWTAARQGAAKFGGSVRSYFAAALRAAYAAARKPKTLEIYSVTASNGVFHKVMSPVSFDRAFVAGMKNRVKGAYCRKEGDRFVWAIAADADGVERFHEVVSAARARFERGIVGSMNGRNLTAKMNDPYSAY